MVTPVGSYHPYRGADRHDDKRCQEQENYLQAMSGYKRSSSQRQAVPEQELMLENVYINMSNNKRYTLEAVTDLETDYGH